MNPVWKEKWLAGLRDGEYKQVKGSLQRHDAGYCCLGVLCDIVAKSPEGKGMLWHQDGGIFIIHGEEYGGFLPPPIQQITGVSQRGKIDNSEFGETLANLNDNGSTFAQIADVIEAKL